MAEPNILVEIGLVAHTARDRLSCPNTLLEIGLVVQTHCSVDRRTINFIW
jgi:hypothetical protein